MAQILEMPQLVDQDGMTEMEVRRGRIETGLDPQWAATLQSFDQLGFQQEFIAPPLDDLQTAFNINHQPTPEPAPRHSEKPANALRPRNKSIFQRKGRHSSAPPSISITVPLADQPTRHEVNEKGRPRPPRETCVESGRKRRAATTG